MGAGARDEDVPKKRRAPVAEAGKTWPILRKTVLADVGEAVATNGARFIIRKLLF